jgi:hypothetical protein
MCPEATPPSGGALGGGRAAFLSNPGQNHAAAGEPVRSLYAINAAIASSGTALVSITTPAAARSRGAI